MKRLILTRHAKSSWDDPMTPDHDRPLNDRGKAAAADLGSRVGYFLKNGDLYRNAVERMGQSALASRDFVDLFRAAIAWHDFETSAKEGYLP